MWRGIFDLPKPTKTGNTRLQLASIKILTRVRGCIITEYKVHFLFQLMGSCTLLGMHTLDVHNMMCMYNLYMYIMYNMK